MASEMVTVRMCRGDLSTPWGFCLENPGVINKIVGGSLADRAGLQNGDILDEIQGERSPSLSGALRLLETAKYEIELVVLRDPSVSRIWRPQITAEDVVISKFQHSVHNISPSESPQGIVPNPTVKVSLEHTSPTVQVPGFNTTPKAFSSIMETNGRSHSTAKSPVGKNYESTTPVTNASYQNKAEKYLMETGGLFGTDPHVLKAKEQGSLFINSEALKLIKEEDQLRGPQRMALPKSPDAITSREPNVGQGLPHCFICDRSILGLMCKVFDVTLHPDCFQCATCGTSLRNQGHHFLSDKFYCDVHGRQRKVQIGAAQNIGKSFEKISLTDLPRTTTTTLDPDLAVRTPPTAAYPVKVSEPSRAAYQPNVMTTQPLLSTKSPTKVNGTSAHYQNGFSPDSTLTVNTKDSIRSSPVQHTSTTSSESPVRPQLSPEIRRATTPLRNRLPSGRLPIWPPTTTESKRTEAIRYWKIPPEQTETRQKKTLQELIREENHSHYETKDKLPSKSLYASTRPLKATSKRVIPTPHRLLKPMRNPYIMVEQTQPQQNPFIEQERAERLSVTFSEPDTKTSRTVSPSTRNEISEVSKSSSRRSVEVKTPETLDEEEWCSEIVEEKDIITENSLSRRRSDSKDNVDDDMLLPPFDPKTSEFLERQGELIYDEIFEAENHSASSTKKIPSESRRLDEWVDEGFEEVNKSHKQEQQSELDDYTSLPDPNDVYTSPLDQSHESESDEASLQLYNRQPIEEQTSQSSEPEGEGEGERHATIHIIEQHQRSLQEQQDKLSSLLDNAIQCLRNLDSTYHQNISNNNTEVKQEDELETHLANLLREVHETNIDASNLHKSTSPTEEAEIRSPFQQNEISTLEDEDIVVDAFDDSPPSKIIHALHQLGSSRGYDSNCPCPLLVATELKKKTTIYEQNKAEHQLILPTEHLLERSTQQNSMDGIRQRGTLMNQTSRVPICEQCKQAIRGPFVLAAGLTWCPEHFKCANTSCGRRLLDTGFVEENGQKYCEKCFETLIAPICNKCGIPITADCLTALQKQWHPECFVCAHCLKPFRNAAFYLENGHPYCEQDWNSLFTTKCVSCKFPIEAGDRWVEAMGSAFHSNCFNCSICQSNLEGQSFYAKNGLPFCMKEKNLL